VPLAVGPECPAGALPVLLPDVPLPLAAGVPLLLGAEDEPLLLGADEPELLGADDPGLPASALWEAKPNANHVAKTSTRPGLKRIDCIFMKFSILGLRRL